MNNRREEKLEEVSGKSNRVSTLAPRIVYGIEIKKSIFPVKMSYLSNAEKIREIFYLHNVEEGVARIAKGFSIFVQFLQQSAEKSLLLSSLWAGILLTIAFLIMVIILGAH
ncbi:hypothetical protein QPL79_04330 [Ignisphaera sp. 4213-co]|uniref:Uncharacterized protein n=1 Tax=Ignisphaera cupida TaxID=3050454 RepID=A0ABD4Z5Z0_9CREN|nr:hypothetical protein [Ignisphaera sp. 4213-co]MDK6028580.1 hypothetical protein [Ignisphaera sp. 4213-co]